MKDCPACEGTGDAEGEDDDGEFMAIDCPECEGTGEVEDDDE